MKSWNARAHFIVIVSTNTEAPHILALNLLKLLWETANIASVLIITPNEKSTNTINMHDDNIEFNMVNMYTWFPLERNGQDKALLINECLFRNDINCKKFPPEVPEDFMGFPIKVGTIGTEPYVILKSNTTDQYGKKIFEIDGFLVHLVRTVAKKLNASLIFNEPYLDITKDSAMNMLLDLLQKKIDIIAGTLLDLEMTRLYLEPSVRYSYDSVRWIVPCPNSISRAERATKIFSLPLWILMGIVLLLSSLILWCQANYKRSSKSEYNSYKQLCLCFVVTWAALIGISVSKLPNSTQVRIFFIIFVIYSFAMCTVFQAFFTTFLVEPGYEKKIESISEAVQSNISYGETDLTQLSITYTEYTEHTRFGSNTVLCPSYESCAEYVMFNRNIATMVPQHFPSYIASQKGIADESKVVCFLDEILFTFGLSVGFQKGNPLLGVFNKYLTLCIEAGILDGYWSRLKNEVNLRAKPTVWKVKNYLHFQLNN
ncbi:hypothetical protein L9F63_012967 [Diploptera punctata]|uniref:Ionotropic glutamate receptor C-terminal domain-containing protein n=1 Tax=Diploptera punctata TaxID=6984 RepID=A0AAD8EN06_DIPPU|nr:hypothetical protein L9F63_012967 [Diploptera punctata]